MDSCHIWLFKLWTHSQIYTHTNTQTSIHRATHSWKCGSLFSTESWVCALLFVELMLACRHRERQRNVSGNWIVEECIFRSMAGEWVCGQLVHSDVSAVWCFRMWTSDPGDTCHVKWAVTSLFLPLLCQWTTAAIFTPLHTHTLNTTYHSFSGKLFKHFNLKNKSRYFNTELFKCYTVRFYGR